MRVVQEADAVQAVEVGALVVDLDNPRLGIGKTARVTASRVTVEYFDSIAQPVAYAAEVGLGSVAAATLERHQRVYFREASDWCAGIVVEADDGRALVRLPGGAGAIWVDVESLFVRWDRPLTDLVAVMQERGSATPYHYFARRGFIDSMLAETAASRGNAAFTSSAVALHSHQIDVVSRILSDPVRRFLLADEVGMGKTIEAGFVIRQQLLDNPQSVVRIVAPDHTRRQWELELQERFFVDDLVSTDEQVQVLPAEGAMAWALREGKREPDLLVVDEAHHIAVWANEDRERYQRAAKLAHACQGLLLLSATPVAHNEETFLAMLHLLDPANYDLADLRPFRKRVANRNELARAFVLFRPGQKFRRLTSNADRLRQLLGDDEASVALLDRVLGAEAESQDEIDRRIRALRVAVTDRHRIHYRMLRNRRDEADDYLVRQRRLAGTLVAGSEGTEALAAWLEEWRNHLVLDAAEHDCDWLPIARVMFDRALAFPKVFQTAIDRRLGIAADYANADLGGYDGNALTSYPPGLREKILLRRWLEQDVGELTTRREEVIVDFVTNVSRQKKVVVFTSYESTAEQLVHALDGSLSEAALASHGVDQARGRPHRPRVEPWPSYGLESAGDLPCVQPRKGGRTRLGCRCGDPLRRVERD